MNKKNIIATIAALVVTIAALFPLFLAGNLPSYVAKQDELVAKQEGADFAKEYLSYILAHDVDAIKNNAVPEIITPEFNQDLEKIFSVFSAGIPTNLRFIATFPWEYKGKQVSVFRLEYELSNQWTMAEIILQKQDHGRFSAVGIHLTQLINNKSKISDSLESLMQFKFFGQSPTHYLVFSVAIMVLALDIYALVSCIRTPIPKRKWLWIIFILVGFIQIKFNWTDGVFGIGEFTSNADGATTGYRLNFFEFPVIHFSQMLYQPFYATLSIPLGAIIFLIKRKKWLAANQTN